MRACACSTDVHQAGDSRRSLLSNSFVVKIMSFMLILCHLLLGLLLLEGGRGRREGGGLPSYVYFFIIVFCIDFYNE